MSCCPRPDTFPRDLGQVPHPPGAALSAEGVCPQLRSPVSRSHLFLGGPGVFHPLSPNSTSLASPQAAPAGRRGQRLLKGSRSDSYHEELHPGEAPPLSSEGCLPATRIRGGCLITPHSVENSKNDPRGHRHWAGCWVLGCGMKGDRNSCLKIPVGRGRERERESWRSHPRGK